VIFTCAETRGLPERKANATIATAIAKRGGVRLKEVLGRGIRIMITPNLAAYEDAEPA
jgi:hypothetical protein